jgi:hypothetical protein
VAKKKKEKSPEKDAQGIERVKISQEGEGYKTPCASISPTARIIECEYRGLKKNPKTLSASPERSPQNRHR